MMMPAQPATGFIVVKTDFAFAFFKMISIGQRMPLRTRSCQGIVAGALLNRT